MRILSALPSMLGQLLMAQYGMKDQKIVVQMKVTCRRLASENLIE